MSFYYVLGLKDYIIYDLIQLGFYYMLIYFLFKFRQIKLYSFWIEVNNSSQSS